MRDYIPCLLVKHVLSLSKCPVLKLKISLQLDCVWLDIFLKDSEKLPIGSLGSFKNKELKQGKRGGVPVLLKI